MPKPPLARILSFYLRWLGLAATVGVAAGIASAAFLYLLDIATEVRLDHPWLLYALPLSGLAAGALYHRFGRAVEGGNNLIIDEFHQTTQVIPLRLAPLVMVGTVLTHLCGGSAGREGTAVQMGASLADQWTKILKLTAANRAILLMAGMSAGFGSVFGVPLAGTIFGLEVLAVGRLHLRGVMQCGVAALVAHRVTLALGIHHTAYSVPSLPAWSWNAAASITAAGLLFGTAARLFGRLSHHISHHSKGLIPYLPVRAMLGGAIVSSLYAIWPTLVRYSGLGVPIMVESLQAQVPIYDWLGKLGMTALTLGVGFKGGEVTPLLFIGSTLGNALTTLLPLSIPLLSSLGMVAVFAGAANTPLTCTIMAGELFGWSIVPYAALACFCSYLASSHHGIYQAQRVGVNKRAFISRTFKLLRRLGAHLTGREGSFPK